MIFNWQNTKKSRQRKFAAGIKNKRLLIYFYKYYFLSLSEASFVSFFVEVAFESSQDFFEDTPL